MWMFAGGFMESLDNQWILHGNMQQCEQFEKTPNTLGLKNMAGVFILVGAGIVGGICLIIIEVVYKKHQIKKQKRMEIARHAADKWRGTIEVGVFINLLGPFSNTNNSHPPPSTRNEKLCAPRWPCSVNTTWASGPMLRARLANRWTNIAIRNSAHGARNALGRLPIGRTQCDTGASISRIHRPGIRPPSQRTCRIWWCKTTGPARSKWMWV